MGSKDDAREFRTAKGRDSGMVSIALRVFVVFLALLSRLHVPYLFLRLFGSKFKSFMLCYAGSERYADHYSFRFLWPWLRWFPTPIGVYKQGKYWGVIVATPMTEEEFTAPRNATNLTGLIKSLHRIATLAGAETVHLAGILPSFLEKRNPELRVTSNEMIAKVVSAAVTQVIAQHFGGESVPMVLLGGSGKIGRAVQQELRAGHLGLCVVDPVDGLSELPSTLRGRRCLLIDVARAGAIDKYVQQLWPQVVILNEAFPEPRGNTLRAVAQLGVNVLHLSGVVGRVYPSLPHGYSHSVPCCAVHDYDVPLQPVIKEFRSRNA